jgi:geranylgeranyl diphosphate synthase, type I
MTSPAAASVAGPVVDRRLAALFDAERERWSAVDGDLAVPLGALRSHVLSGGKRLRPAFCYWAFLGAGGAAEDPLIIDAGAALEMLHASALVHDDVIDGSRRRHGTDTVHVALAERHRAAGWRGDPQRHGEGMAILVGDLALAYSNRLLAGAPRPAVAVFEEMCIEVNMGQYLDMLGAAQGLDVPPGQSAERARRIRRYKTAKYTVERPLHLGAALATPDRLEELREPLSRFGLPLGEAFQLRDDLLGLYGDPTVTGKPVGDDLREGKPTLLASLALERQPERAGRLLRAGMGKSDLTEAEVNEIRAAVEDSGAKAEVEAAISDLLAVSNEALGCLPLLPEAVKALGDLAEFVAGRDY